MCDIWGALRKTVRRRGVQDWAKGEVKPWWSSTAEGSNDPMWHSRAPMALQGCRNCIQGLCNLSHIDQSLQVWFPQGGGITLSKGQFSERDTEICQQSTSPAAGQCGCSAGRASGQPSTTSTTPVYKLLPSPQGSYSPLAHHEVHGGLTLYSLFSYLRYSHHSYKILPGVSSITTEFKGHKDQNVLGTTPNFSECRE